MYLAALIDEILESKKSKLLGRLTYFHIVDVLTRAFRKKEPFKFRFELYEEYDKEDFSVSGLYDMVDKKKYIILNFPKRYKTFTIDNKNWKNFKFAISQVCQHEAIHYFQWQNRIYDGKDGLTLDFKTVECSPEEVREYLSDIDEIDAYAHDIAMEIKYFYPKKDPYTVLAKINNHRKIWSYGYYKKSFRGTDWLSIKKRLLKRTYYWMPYVKV